MPDTSRALNLMNAGTWKDVHINGWSIEVLASGLTESQLPKKFCRMGKQQVNIIPYMRNLYWRRGRRKYKLNKEEIFLPYFYKRRKNMIIISLFIKIFCLSFLIILDLSFIVFMLKVYKDIKDFHYKISYLLFGISIIYIIFLNFLIYVIWRLI